MDAHIDGLLKPVQVMISAHTKGGDPDEAKQCATDAMARFKDDLPRSAPARGAEARTRRCVLHSRPSRNTFSAPSNRGAFHTVCFSLAQKGLSMCTSACAPLRVHLCVCTSAAALSASTTLLCAQQMRHRTTVHPNTVLLAPNLGKPATLTTLCCTFV